MPAGEAAQLGLEQTPLTAPLEGPSVPVASASPASRERGATRAGKNQV